MTLTQKLSKFLSYSFLVMVPSAGLFHFYLGGTVAGYHLSVLDFTLWVAFATFAMDFCVNKRPFLPHAMDKWMLFLFGTCIFFVVLGIYNRNDKVLVWGLRSTWTLLLLYFPLSHLAASNVDQKRGLIRFVLIYSTIVGLSAILLRFGLLSSIVNPTMVGADAVPTYGPQHRITWVCRPVYSAIALSFCLGIFVLRHDLVQLAGGKISWFLCVAANFTVVMLAKSRTWLFAALLTIALTGILIWIYNRKHSDIVKRLVTFLTISVIVVGLFASFLQEDFAYFVERVSSIGMSDRTINIRMLSTEKELQSFLENPILGKGLGFTDWYYYRADGMWRRTYGEISIVFYLVWFGLAGMAVLYTFLTWLLVKSLKLLKNSDLPLDKAIGAVCAALIVVMMITGLVFIEHTVVLILVAVLLRKPATTQMHEEKSADID